MKEIHITKDTQEAGIAFVLPGQQIFAYMEKPGSKNIAIRMAGEDAIEFFTQRYMEYHTALKNVNDALTAASADDPNTTRVNSCSARFICDSSTRRTRLRGQCCRCRSPAGLRSNHRGADN